MDAQGFGLRVERGVTRLVFRHNWTSQNSNHELAGNVENLGHSDLAGKYFKLEKKRLDPKIVALRRALGDRRNRGKEDESKCRDMISLERAYWERQRRAFPKLDIFDRFFSTITNCELYSARDSKSIDRLLDEMSTMRITSVRNFERGTQIKLIVEFENGKKALMKPMRFDINYETNPNHFYFNDFERSNAEIAAFHLDRLLGFRRAIPTVGRVFNITSDLRANSDKSIEYFVSPAHNQCFVGKCRYYCDTTHAICGHPDSISGSLQLWIPEYFDERQTVFWKSPYRRTYSKIDQIAEWQSDPTYCERQVKNVSIFEDGRRLLDLIDLHIFDFLIGNQDRHHLESLSFFDQDRYPSHFLHYDNGRGFGSPHTDDMDILAPLTQCCVIRPSTLGRLLEFHLDGSSSLADRLDRSLRRDPTYPVLAPKYLNAIDRRVEVILREVVKCVEKVD